MARLNLQGPVAIVVKHQRRFRRVLRMQNLRPQRLQLFYGLLDLVVGWTP